MGNVLSLRVKWELTNRLNWKEATNGELLALKNLKKQKGRVLNTWPSGHAPENICKGLEFVFQYPPLYQEKKITEIIFSKNNHLVFSY